MSWSCKSTLPTIILHNKTPSVFVSLQMEKTQSMIHLNYFEFAHFSTQFVIWWIN